MIDTPHPAKRPASTAAGRCSTSSRGRRLPPRDPHIIRGIDLQDSAKRQRFVYDYFDWEYPEVIHWGHVQLSTTTT